LIHSETLAEKRVFYNIWKLWSDVGGREKIMKLMDEAKALGSKAVTRMMAHK